MSRLLVRVTKIVEGEEQLGSLNPDHVAYVDRVHPRAPVYLENAGGRSPKKISYVRFVGDHLGWLVKGSVEEITARLNAENPTKKN